MAANPEMPTPKPSFMYILSNSGNNNIQRMEEHALKLKATILDYYKQLEAILKNLSTKSNFSDVKVNLFLNGIKKEFTEKSAMSMLMQVSENHANALSLLP